MIGKKLRQGIPHLGYFWEAVDSQDVITGDFLGKSVASFLIPTL